MTELFPNVTTYEQVEALITALAALPKGQVLKLVHACGHIRHTSKAAALKRLKARLEARIDRARPVNGLDCMCG